MATVHLDQLCRVSELHCSDLIICVEFQKLDELDLEGLVSYVALVISNNIYT